MASYTYSIANDTLNGVLANDSLMSAIHASTITIDVQSVIGDGDELRVEFKTAISPEEKSTLDGLVSNHNGQPLSTLEVLPVQVHTTQGEGLNLFLHGIEFEATAGKVTEFNFVLPEEREIEGARAHVYNHEPGDRLDMEFWAPTGLEAPAPTELMVGRNACDVYIPPTGELPEIRSNTAKLLPAGLMLRVRYHSESGASVNPRVAVNVRWHRKSAV